MNMYSYLSIHFFAALSLFLATQNAVAIDLKPIRPASSNGLGKRADTAALDLRSEETFLWGLGTGPSSGVLANFTMSMPGAEENVLSMERFAGMLTKVDCSIDTMVLAFKDDATFAYAQQSWDWVNGADNHTFVMVAGAGDCGWNKDRQPFNVSTLTYDEVNNVAKLAAVPVEWKTVAHTYDLQVGHIEKKPAALTVRDITKDLSLDMHHDFPFSISSTDNGLSTTIACLNCSSFGTMNMEMRIKTKFFIPTGASMRITPSGVGAVANLKLTESGTLTKGFGYTKTILSIPLDSITIPGGILNLGPNLDFSVGFDVGTLTGSASIGGGAEITIPDSAVLNFNLLSPEENEFSGWDPIVTPIPLTVDAKISAGLDIFVETALDLVAEAIGHGYMIGLKLKMPNFHAELNIIDSPTGACGTQQQFGVQILASIGAKLSLEASSITNQGNPFLNIAIATVLPPIGQFCVPLGPLITPPAPTSPASTEPPPAASTTAAPPPVDTTSAPPPPETTSAPPPPVDTTSAPLPLETTSAPPVPPPTTSAPIVTAPITTGTAPGSTLITSSGPFTNATTTATTTLLPTFISSLAPTETGGIDNGNGGFNHPGNGTGCYVPPKAGERRRRRSRLMSN